MLLALARGGGSMPAFGPFDVQTSGGGGWPGPLTRSVCHYNGVTYVGYIDGTGQLEIKTISDAGAFSAATVLHTSGDWGEIDWHDAPSVLVREPDHKIVTAACRHVGANMYVRISSAGESIAAFDASVDIGASLLGSGRAFTYPNLHQLAGEANQPLYLFFRQHTTPDGPTGTSTQLCYSKSTDGGATWSALTRLYESPGKANYWQIASNGDDRIDIMTTSGTGPSEPGEVYHFYYLGGSFYKSDGTLITASLPFAPADLTQVYPGTTKHARAIHGLSVNDGMPVGAFPVTADGTDTDYVYARWTGSAWAYHTVVSGAGVDSAFVEGGIALDERTTRICYVSRIISGEWEVERKRTLDGGATWTTTDTITSGSSDANFGLIVPRDRGNHVHCVWLQGPATDYTDYDVDLQALVT